MDDFVANHISCHYIGSYTLYDMENMQNKYTVAPRNKVH